MKGFIVPHSLSRELAVLLPLVACCDVTAYGTAQAAEDEVDEMRRKPVLRTGEASRATFLKHADEQTVLGLAALVRAMHAFHLSEDSFGDWGILAAPRFLGRMAMAHALHKFAAEGAWGMSPHLIPNRSLHSVSGTLSQALKIHGPNFGVGGGIGSEAEAFRAAFALLDDRSLPGLWLVLTGWDPEPAPGGAAVKPVCRALALALVAAREERRGHRLRYVPSPLNGTREAPSPTAAGQRPLRLESLTAAFADAGTLPATWIWRLGAGDRLELDLTGTGEETRS